MNFFRRLKIKVAQWSCHQHARYYLAGVSFFDASVFPIPPDVMLIPMVLYKPNHAWQYAWLTIVASLLGAMLGYLIGYYAFELIGQPIIHFFHAEQSYLMVEQWFDQYGILAILVAGFTPIPYKLFTIGAGTLHMLIFPFIVASLIGRSIRFFVVAGLAKGLGKKVVKS